MNKENENQQEAAQKQGFAARQKDKLVNKTEKLMGYGAIKDGFEYIRENLALLNPFRKRNAKVETFEESYKRHNLDEGTLAKIYKNLIARFFIAMLVTGGLWVWMFYLAVHGTILTALAVCAISVATCALAWSTAFRLHQLYRREWCTVSEWWGGGESRWPKSWEEASLAQKRRLRDRRSELR